MVYPQGYTQYCELNTRNYVQVISIINSII
jgi:hypothetical protein